MSQQGFSQQSLACFLKDNRGRCTLTYNVPAPTKATAVLSAWRFTKLKNRGAGGDNFCSHAQTIADVKRLVLYCAARPLRLAKQSQQRTHTLDIHRKEGGEGWEGRGGSADDCSHDRRNSSK